MSTPITDFYEPIRFVLGDRDSTIRQYDDGALASAFRSAARMNFLPGYTLTTDRLSVQPTITDPNKYALLIYKVAKQMVAPDAGRYSFRTRALAESFGDRYPFIQILEDSIHELETGVMFAGWQNLNGWWSGMFGVSLFALLTAVKVEAPWRTLTIAEGSATIDDEEERMQDDIPFTNVGALATGSVFLGEYEAKRKIAITGAIVNCDAPMETVTLGCFINGIEAGELAMTIGSGQSRIEMGFDRLVGQGDSVRWRCTGAPEDAPQSASEVSLNMHVERREG